MNFFQKVLIKILLGVIEVSHFIEKKLIELLSISVFNIVIILFLILNISFFTYLFNGLFVGNSSESGFIAYAKPEEKVEVLGASMVRELAIPQISAKVALVVDKNSDQILYELNSSETLASASTTKLMTALVSLDLYGLEEQLIVQEFCTVVAGSKVGLPVGEVFSVDTLLNALLIQSGADAACVLSNSKVSYMDFVDLMNAKASALGMTNTYFTNPIGLDGINDSHYSTAKDLYLLAKYSMKENAITKIVGTKEYGIVSTNGLFTKDISNTNKLLWEIPNTIGIKTGTTVAAGEVLIYEYLEGNIDLIIIVMNSTDRFYDTSTLLNWTLSSYSWVSSTD